jgi:RNA polymerase-binding transcription factor DksA
MAKNKANIDEKTLAELKKDLLDKKNRITADLASFAQKSKDIKGSFDTKFAQIGDRPDENASEVTMYEDNLGVEHSLEKDLEAINNALKKIEDGTYGLCYNCGAHPQPIELKRLKAFPEAETCLKCSTGK